MSDERIALLLRSDGRMPVSRLADELGTTRTAVTARLAELRASGRLQITAVVNPWVLGITASAHVALRFDGSLRAGVAAIRAMGAVSLVSVVSGDADLVTEVRAPTAARLFAQLGDLRRISGVREIETLNYVSVVKSPFTSPREPATAVRLDELDEHLLVVLQQDGRASFRSMADAVGVTESVARHRIHRMISDDVVRVTAVLRRSADSSGVAMGMGLNVDGDIDELTQMLAAMARVDFVAVVTGRHDILLTLSGSSLQQLAVTADEVRAVAGVRRVRHWVHLEMFHEAYRPDGLVAGSPSIGAADS